LWTRIVATETVSLCRRRKAGGVYGAGICHSRYPFSTETSVALIIAKTSPLSLRFIRWTEPVVMIDTAEGCGNVEVAIDRAPAKELRQARAVDPGKTRTLLALVRKNSEPSYRRNRCGFAAILKGKK
jgi:hypothetical protein